MNLKSWLNLFGRTPRRARTSGHPTAAERFEDRSLLSVSALFIDGELFVSSDGGDSIAVRQNVNGRVEILANGQTLATAPNVLTSAITSIVIRGGDEANNINLNEVNATTYPSITSIFVDGDDGDDTILGSPVYADNIFGGDGTDSITGQGGNDTLDGGDGNDTILGQDGDDSLIGEDGNDSISGDAGNDTIDGGNHQDTITGGAGDDVIDAGQNSDLASGGDGNDTITGGEGTDTINGDLGNDSLIGGAGNDLVNGGDGSDTLLGQTGFDVLNGDGGNDSLNGGNSNDTLSGGLGDDTLNGGAGNDSMLGNEGNDLAFGGAGNDLLDGFVGNDTLKGQGGNDTLLGNIGADNLDGGAGADLLDSADPLPEVPPFTVSVADVSVLEGNTGTTDMIFTLTLSAPSFLPVSVTVSTGDGSANAGPDYTAITNQVFTIAPGTTSTTVTVPIITDPTNETDETLRLVLSNPVNARLLNQEAIGIINNDDAPPVALFATSLDGRLFQLDVNTAAPTFVAFTQGNSDDITADANNIMIGLAGTTLYTTNTLNGSTTNISTVTGRPNPSNEGDLAYDTAANVIFASFSTVAAVPPDTIGPGNPNLFRIIPATGAAQDLGELQTGATPADVAGVNDVVEWDYLAYRPAAGTQPAVLYGVIASGVTGNNANFNDALFSINPNAGNAVATRIGPLGVDVGVIPATPPVGFTTFGGMDWDASTNTLLLLDGQSQDLYRIDPATGTATLIGNVGLTGAIFSGLSFAENPALPVATVTINDVTVTEADQGTSTATFTLTRSSLLANQLGAATVNFSTVDGTATAGSDYVAQSGTVSFLPGQLTATITVTLNEDFNLEGDETFFVQLTSASGVSIADGSGVATIVNNDAFPLGDTLRGGTDNDTIIGGPAADFINGDGGNDSILGNGGDDTILGGAGLDTINGGDGNDSINGQGGVDVIDGGAGDDVLVFEGGAGGNDVITNETGSDTVLVSLGNANHTVTVGQAGGLLTVTEGGSTVTIDSSITTVTIDAGGGDDTVAIGNLDTVQRGTLIVRGGAGHDVLTAQDSNTALVRVRMEGDDGNDTLIGGQGGDTLVGGAGNDRIRGGLGNDQVLGGTGADSVNGEGGNDTLFGGDGTDTLAGDGNDTLSGDAGNDSLRGDAGNDSLLGGDGNDTARGGDGNDTISGDAGNDSLLGDAASDNITGGDGNDTLDGGRNNDILNGMSGDDKIRGDHGDDTIAGGAGNDTINGGDGDDRIQGQVGHDLITGADGDDTINGQDGNDTITGGDGDDVITGDGGNDIILGEQGDDSINGQASTDTLAGGQGDDTIVAAAAGEIDEQFVLSSALQSALSAT